MASYKERVKELAKAGKQEKLSSTPWTAQNGQVLVGELIHRQIIHSNKSTATFDKVTLRTDEGVFDTIISSDILPLAKVSVKRGDILQITAKDRKDEVSGKTFTDKLVEVFHVESTGDDIPF